MSICGKEHPGKVCPNIKSNQKPTAQDFQRWVAFLEDVLEWVSCIDCEEPAGMHCSRIDLKGGEEACMPCRCKEAYEKIVKRNN